MTNSKVDLSHFNPHKYKHGKSKWLFALWHVISYTVFQKGWLPSSAFRVFLLRLFGANIGKGVVMNKPGINIKYPWKLTIGKHSWIGENCWLYNMDEIRIGSHVNIAQGALLLTGNHDFTVTSFDVFTKPIEVQDGCFIGAQAMIAPGVTCQENCIIAMGAVVLKNTEPNAIYRGNPAKLLKRRND